MPIMGIIPCPTTELLLPCNQNHDYMIELANELAAKLLYKLQQIHQN